MKKSFVLVGVALVLAFTIGFSAAAKPALRDNVQVTQGLIAVGMALELEKQCDTLSTRLLKGLSYLNTLKGMARAQGYSDAEIEAFVDNKTEKRALEAKARAMLEEKGAQPGNAPSYCAVGGAEIAAGSVTGGLLRAR